MDCDKSMAGFKEVEISENIRVIELVDIDLVDDSETKLADFEALLKANEIDEPEPMVMGFSFN